MSSVELLPLIRDLYSRNPEYRQAKLAAWELQTLLWSLCYTDELEDEGEIAGAAAKLVAQTDWTGATYSSCSHTSLALGSVWGRRGHRSGNRGGGRHRMTRRTEAPGAFGGIRPGLAAATARSNQRRGEG